ncbi:S41 family peptidase [Pedobacter punctiformis]|uniref:S41 family peptidase n=1 Tax=Pedobacter punctiformis TaxID=3004097 RepID=A0ABT4LA93_9SPHI|nr:S41 family peptidase [Pedobacter sp. HCMS5-2]MCZ4244607.1 S41 family peptidase [Pedobacter sp. HCMS5-2]
MKNHKFNALAVVLLLCAGVLFSCKKNKSPDTPPTPEVPTVSGTRSELTKDSIFLYSKELYYWNTSLPTYDAFNPRSYASNETELYAITQFSLNPSTGKPYEYVSKSTSPKYSFIDYVSTSGKTGALKADINTENDFGFSVFYQNDTDLRVKYVYANSSAGAQGLTRGCKITSINGRTDLTLNDANIDYVVNAIFGTSPSVALTFTDLGGVSKSVTITNTSYTVNPILYTNVYTVDTKKVGYLVFNSFTNNQTTALNAVFADFAAKGVTELIVDLRYNGGGYISTAAQIINAAAPAAQTGNTMFTYYYSSYLQNLTTAQRKASVLIHQPLLDDDNKLQTGNFLNGKYATYADVDYLPTAKDNVEKFSKSGTLNLSRVYFIVTSSTASASELTINCLKPVMDVKLIGSTTYGKPVGFFPVRIDKLDLYIPEFETKNQVGTGGYYTGLTVDKVASEDLTKPWGDQNETLLSYALLYAKNGNFITTPAKTASLKAGSSTIADKLSADEVKRISVSLDGNRFNGMIREPGRKLQ